MSVSTGWIEHLTPQRDVPVSPEVHELARIEGLVGEELALLGIPEPDRTPAQHARLRSVGAELDRLWDVLRERAERLADHRRGPGAATV